VEEYTESFPKRDAELGRYRRAGASGTARLTIPEGEDLGDDFFCGRFMDDYSEAVLIEGDAPVSYIDLRVFVSRPPRRSESLLIRPGRSPSSIFREGSAPGRN
jgi:hypothetical protein